MPDPVIYPNDKLRAVKSAKALTKRALIRAGQKGLASKINDLPVHGPASVAGVKWLQKNNGLKVDGIIGPNTWAMLRKRGSVIHVDRHVIRPRRSWNPQPPKAKPTKVEWTRATTFFLHHTVTKPPTNGGAAGEKAAMRELQRVAFSRGFNDISYSYLVFPSGNIYAGRGHEVEGAHTLGHNEDIGVALVGNYETSKVTAAQKNAVKWLQKKLKSGAMKPHNAVSSTACPGKNAEAAFGL